MRSARRGCQTHLGGHEDLTLPPQARPFWLCNPGGPHFSWPFCQSSLLEGSEERSCTVDNGGRSISSSLPGGRQWRDALPLEHVKPIIKLNMSWSASNCHHAPAILNNASG